MPTPVFIEGGGSGPGGNAGAIFTAGFTSPQSGSIWNGARSPSSDTGVTVDTTVKEHGFSWLRHDSGASLSAYVSRIGVLDANRRGSHRLRFTSLGTANTANATRFWTFQTSASAQYGGIGIRANGSVFLLGGASGTTLLGSSAVGALVVGTWHRISWAHTITSATVNEWRVWLDGALVITASNAASQVLPGTGGVLRLGWSGTSPGTNIVAHSQDHYVDDGVGAPLLDTGDVRVTAKRPVGVTLSGFDTLVGTASTSRAGSVAERPINTANGTSHLGTTLARDTFTVEAEGVGDDNLTGATILGWAGWIHYSVAAAAGSTAQKLVVNAVDVTQASVAASGAYQTGYAVAGVQTYPAAGAVGLTSTTSAVDTLLRECGVYVAYTSGGAAPSPAPPPWYTVRRRRDVRIRR